MLRAVIVLILNKLLTIAGGLSILYRIFGAQVTGAIYKRVHYDIGKIRKRDIGVTIRNGRLVGLLNLRLFVQQKFGISISLSGLDLEFTQSGNQLGHVKMNKVVVLPNDTTTTVPFQLEVPAGKFLDHIQRIIDGSQASVLAPVSAKGKAYLSNGVSIPISFTLNFLSLG